jgi:uncharacterized protein YdaU (DUF1376 family)
MSDKKKKPIWMPLYIAEFIADTASLTAVQGWAYINLICAMWRTEDGTLPNDADKLARVGKVHRPRWEKVWEAIKSLFDVDGDRVTSKPLQAELGKANALIVSRRAAASVGGRTTQFRRSMKGSHRSPHSQPMTAPKPLNNNDGAQATALASLQAELKPTTTTNIKEEEERESEPLPCDGKASASLKKEASRERVDPAKPPEAERERQVAEWEAHKRKMRGV